MDRRRFFGLFLGPFLVRPGADVIVHPKSMEVVTEDDPPYWHGEFPYVMVNRESGEVVRVTFKDEVA